MAKKEVKTDLWVYELLKDAKIELTPQGSDIFETNEALKKTNNRKVMQPTDYQQFGWGGQK